MSAFSKYRYPGVRPFETIDRDVFFGRDRDRDDLLGLIVLEKLVVLFGKSGYGKSSLLNAAVLPALEARGYQSMTLRMGTFTQGQLTPTELIVNRLAEKSEPSPELAFLDKICPNKSLWYEFKRRTTLESDPSAINRVPSTVLVFDQFEEYFQQPPALRRAFEDQLAELLYTEIPQEVLDNSLDCTDEQMTLLLRPLDVRVVFSIRADRLSELDGMKTRLPAILQKRYELRALSREQAREAIEKPADQPGDFVSPRFTYAPEALDQILRDLLRSNQAQQTGIEAFQLQIVCDHLDNRVASGQVPDRDSDGRPDVGVADLPDFEHVFGEYYARRLDLLPPESRAAARNVIEEELIFENEQTGEARRISLDKDILLQNAAAFGATETLLHDLENTFLLRREPNPLGGYNYEISHDTLLGPVLRSKHERLAGERATRAERERAEAEERVREAEANARRETARRRRANLIAVAALVLAVLAILASIFAYTAQRRAAVALQHLQTEQAEKNRLRLQQLLTDAQTYLASGDTTLALGKLAEARAVDSSSVELKALETVARPSGRR